MYEYYEWGKAGSKLAIYGGDGGMPFEARRRSKRRRNSPSFLNIYICGIKGLKIQN